MNASIQAHRDVAMSLHQRLNISTARYFGLIGLGAVENEPRFRAVPVGRGFFHIIDTRTGKVKGFRRDHNAACAFARKLEQE